LTAASREAIVRADVLAFSSVSAWEIGTLARRGRIDIHFGTGDWLHEVKDTFSLEVLP
jgi:PIN domain nuclease of toxin-antitoxin system